MEYFYQQLKFLGLYVLSTFYVCNHYTINTRAYLMEVTSSLMYNTYESCKLIP